MSAVGKGLVDVLRAMLAAAVVAYVVIRWLSGLSQNLATVGAVAAACGTAGARS